MSNHTLSLIGVYKLQIKNNFLNSSLIIYILTFILNSFIRIFLNLSKLMNQFTISIFIEDVSFLVTWLDYRWKKLYYMFLNYADNSWLFLTT